MNSCVDSGRPWSGRKKGGLSTVVARGFQRVNDLAEHTTSTVRLFADDCVTVMYKSVKSVRDCQELQDLIQLQAWQERWLLRFNPRKCNIMRATHATRKKIEFPYALDDTPLADTPSTSYLGV